MPAIEGWSLQVDIADLKPKDPKQVLLMVEGGLSAIKASFAVEEEQASVDPFNSGYF